MFAVGLSGGTVTSLLCARVNNFRLFMVLVGASVTGNCARNFATASNAFSPREICDAPFKAIAFRTTSTQSEPIKPPH